MARKIKQRDWKLKKGEIEQAESRRRGSYEHMANHPEESQRVSPIWFYEKPYYFKLKERLAKKEGDKN